MTATAAPLIAHLIYRLDIGGLENGLVNLINTLPDGQFRHAIVCMDDFTDFRHRIQRPGVSVVALHKRPGKDVRAYGRLWQVLRGLKPAIVHTRNFATLDAQAVSVMAGVRGRVHGEHGRDVIDLDGTNVRQNRVRKALRSVIHAYIAVSADLAHWLRSSIGVPHDRVFHIYNGVDCFTFSPRPRQDEASMAAIHPFGGRFVVGTVGRLATVKDQPMLVEAYIRLVQRRAELRGRVALAIVGGGPLLEQCRARLGEAGLLDHAWLPGERTDVPAVMRSFDLFVLPSLVEGISNTILEAMATGLPVVATNVGGNPELIDEGLTGSLVPSGDAEALSRTIERYYDDRGLGAQHGAAGRRKVESRFSMAAMTASYARVYDDVLRKSWRRAPGKA